MKTLAIYCLSSLLLLCCLIAHGQGENNVWAFSSHMGLDFNGGPPVSIWDSIAAYEGSTSVSDANGNLLFYASCEKVWDRSNNLMPNGSGLLGSNSATQGAAIIQSFTNPSQYYLFNIGTDYVPHNLCYSLVDMTLNGGMGDVVPGQKNVLIDSNISEKMVPISNGCSGAWLLVHKKDSAVFHAFRVDVGGLHLTPVISNSGFYNIDSFYTYGEMKYAPATGGIALTNNNHYESELHSFNMTTGIVSNPMQLDSASLDSYGVSYSPDGSKLYLNGYQYNLSLLPNIQAVINSKVSVGVVPKGMRIGPDGKVYVVNWNYGENIAVINNPNQLGAVYVYNAVTLLPLPAILEWSLGTDAVVSGLSHSHVTTDSSLCLGVAPVMFSAPPGGNTYLWSDGTTQQSDTFTAAGTKWVISLVNCASRVDTFHLTALPIIHSSVVKDTFLCFANGIPILSAPPGYDSYHWSDGITQQQDTFGNAGTKWVQLGRLNDCSILTDTFNVHAGYDTTNHVTDTTLCVAYSPIPISAAAGYNAYLWSDGRTTQSDTFFATGSKWVRALNGCSLLIDTIHFTATTIPQDSVVMHGRDTAICFESGNINVDGPAGYTYYMWSDGTPVQTDLFTGPATKWVFAQKHCYLLIDTFTVSSQPVDTLGSRVDTLICFSALTTLSADTGYANYRWSDGNTGISDTFSINAVKVLYAHRACEEKIDTFHVSFINDLAVHLGNDTALCKGELIMLNARSTYNTATYLWQDNSTAATYTVTGGGEYSVKVSLGPCSVRDTIQVHQKVIAVKLGSGTVPCGETELRLDAGIDSASYLWQDGSTGRILMATKEGSYSVKVTQGLCSATASVNVRFEACPCVVVLPGAFSPNGDGVNDVYGPHISCDVSSYRFMIYNRWGNKVFYSENPNDKWNGMSDGRPVDAAVYYYYLEFKDGDNKSYYYKGDITMIR